ncbi:MULTISPECIES: hypothetical protein [Agrobacterium]|uniref:Uncharacterized protein n=1 Tax=Agrobacterium rosae TaxID=1972867 RepID=A0A1R3U0D0_9HYPH|nr:MULTISPECIES: hypothetical protein [Agrobacterium]UHS59955.1 hypothetical protein HRS00_23820 [Agrobacterium vaccinii]SCX31913.1 hypothetical protein DSM25559_3828 [Agrobacterium rosae]
MLEYSDAYLQENERILGEMDNYMSDAAIALAKQMAHEDLREMDQDDEE